MLSMPMPPTSSSAMDTETTGSVVRGQADVLVLLEERDVGVTVEGVEHRVGAGALELVHDRREVGVAQRGVLLADDLDVVGAGPGDDLLVGRAREDVVGADQEDLRLALLLEVVHAGQDLLVGRRARVEDVRRRLQALVLDRVEQQGVLGLEDGEHRLARRGRPAAEHRGDAVGRDELLGLLREHGRLGGAVLGDDLELLAQDPAVGVDLLGGQVEGVADRLLGDGHGAGQRVEEADLDGVAGRVDARGRRRRAGVRRVVGGAGATAGDAESDGQGGRREGECARAEIWSTERPFAGDELRGGSGLGPGKRTTPRCVPRCIHPCAHG